MTRRLLVGTMLLALPMIAHGEDKTASRPTKSNNANFEKMKKLTGTWLAADDDGKPTDRVVSVLKLTSGGSVLHETLFPGQSEEMVSIYTVEGSDLIMTHYCVLGNQPRLKADPNSSADQICFQFAGGANLDPAKDKHMHSVTLTIIDDNSIELAGVGWQGGAPAKDMCHGMKLVRKKS